MKAITKFDEALQSLDELNDSLQQYRNLVADEVSKSELLRFRNLRTLVTTRLIEMSNLLYFLDANKHEHSTFRVFDDLKKFIRKFEEDLYPD